METFSLNMSQEACHWFAGLALGGMIVPRVLLLLVVLFLIAYLVTKLFKPTLEELGIKIKDKLFKKRR